MRRFTQSCVSLGVLLALSACTVGPDYAPPVSVKPAGFVRGGLVSTSAPEAPAARWWEGLGDVQLSSLIEQGLAHAPQIAIAEARLRQARSSVASSRAGMMPAVGVTTGYLHADLPGTPLASFKDFYNLGFDAQWEVDLWGGKRRGLEQSRAQADAVLAELGDAQVALAAEIARNYVTLRAREASRALIAERHGLEAQQVVAAQQRLAAGTATRQTLEAARATLDKTEAEQAAVAADVAALHDALAVLTGQAPGALDGLAAGAVPLPPAEVKVGDPAALIARRPDIRAADRAYAAATAGVGVAQAKRFPSISLMGIVGLGGTGVSDVVDPSTFVSLITPTLRWNALDFGRTEAGIRGAKAGRELALARYQGAVLAGLQDAESALARFGAARTGWAKSGSAAGHAGEIARLQAMRAQAGTIARADALEAERQNVNARLAQINDRASLTLSYVALSKALGLGWGGLGLAGVGNATR